MRAPQPRARLVWGVLLCLAGAAGPLASQTAPDTAAMERRLSAARDGSRIPILLQLAEARRDEPAAVLRFTDEALSLLARHPSVEMEVGVRLLRSRALELGSNFPEALGQAEQGLALARRAGADTLLVAAHIAVGTAHWRLSAYTPALAHAESALALESPGATSRRRIRALNLMGGIHEARGDLDPAMERFLQALHASEALGDEREVARAHNNIGVTYWDLGRLDDALAALRRALPVLERVGPEATLANTLNNIGLVLGELHRDREAIPYLERALAIDRRVGNLYGQAKDLNNLGWSYKGLGERARAKELFRQGLALREQIGDKDGIIRSRGSLAEMAVEDGDLRTGIALAEQNIALADSIGDKLNLSDQLGLLARARAMLGDSAGAFRALRQFHDLQTALADSSMKANTAELEARYRTREQERELAAAQALATSQQGALRWLLVASMLLAGFLLMLGVLYAMRGRAQQELAESEQRYRALFHTSVGPTFLVEVATGRLLDANAPARALCGMGASGQLFLDAVAPEWVRRALTRAVAAAGPEPVALDDSWSDPTGRLRWTELRGSTVTLGGRTCLLVSLRDATEDRHAEEARQREDKMRSLGALAGGIAHDFNNALTAILGHVTLAREGAPAEREEMLAQATQAALGARRLTTQLLAFARGGEPVRRSTDLGLLLGDALALAGAGSHMRVDLEVAPGLWHALVDGGQFRQVVSTLVLNAEQATGEGGRLVVRATNVSGRVVPGTPPGHDRWVQIEFADNGPGVPADIRGRIFDPYFSTRPGGTGLGLTSALTICQNHEGTLTMDSAPGAGATFRVYLPATDEAPVAPTPIPAPAPDGHGRILVLDDEPAVRRVLQRMLERWGYEVETVADGAAAIARYVEVMHTPRAFDLLIMDLTIPGGMGGRQAISEILKLDPSARAIVASGYSDDPTMAHYQEAGFLAALPKPFEQAELAEVVGAVMRTGRARR